MNALFYKLFVSNNFRLFVFFCFSFFVFCNLVKFILFSYFSLHFWIFYMFIFYIFRLKISTCLFCDFCCFLYTSKPGEIFKFCFWILNLNWLNLFDVVLMILFWSLPYVQQSSVISLNFAAAYIRVFALLLLLGLPQRTINKLEVSPVVDYWMFQNYQNSLFHSFA